MCILGWDGRTFGGFMFPLCVFVFLLAWGTLRCLCCLPWGFFTLKGFSTFFFFFVTKGTGV